MPIRYTSDGEPYLDSSRMTARITFLQPVTISDAAGAAVEYRVGSPPDTTWSEIVPVRGTDVIKAGQDVSQTYIVATIRYRPPGRSARMKFRDSRGLVYEIQAVEDVVPGRLTFQVLTCVLISANA